jgi:hypothetical protein
MAGIQVPSSSMEDITIGSHFPMGNNCPGYCKDPQKRRLAMLCAFDNVALKGKAGVEIFPEFNDNGI